MSNYSQTTYFAPKDALTPGDPLKIIRGTQIDTELLAISTAVGTKLDTAGAGIALSSTTVSVSIATATALGAAPAADDLILISDTSNSAAIRKLTFTEMADLLAGTVTTTGLSDTTGVLKLDIANMTAETSVVGSTDYVVIYDASAAALRKVLVDNALAGGSGYVPSSRNLTAGTGLTGGGTLASDRTFALDISALTAIAIAATAPTDGLLLDDSGVMKRISIQDIGVRVEDSDAIQTFALVDATTLQNHTGSGARVWTIPTNASVAFGVGAVIYLSVSGTGTITLTPDTGVTLTCTISSATTARTVLAGGMAALIKVATNTWMVSGDIV